MSSRPHWISVTGYFVIFILFVVSMVPGHHVKIEAAKFSPKNTYERNLTFAWTNQFPQEAPQLSSIYNDNSSAQDLKIKKNRIIAFGQTSIAAQNKFDSQINNQSFIPIKVKECISADSKKENKSNGKDESESREGIIKNEMRCNEGSIKENPRRKMSSESTEILEDIPDLEKDMIDNSFDSEKRLKPITRISK